ncbi:MAG: hypothetical protein GY893_06235 [bacterium]|nr:hypothetical protein [bacterium]
MNSNQFNRSNKVYTALLIATLSIIASGVYADNFFAVGDEDLMRSGSPENIIRNLDCNSAVMVELSIWSEVTLDGSTEGIPDSCNSYSCEEWDESGGEIIYELEVDQPIILHATLFSEPDLDLILLSDCDPDLCIGMASSEFSAEIDSGTYYLIVDGYLGESGAFSVTLETMPAYLLQEACDSATPIECSPIETIVDSNLFEQPNLIETADCNTFLERGGEQWFSVVLPDTATVEISLTQLFFDGAIWLFDDCGPDAECIAFADQGTIEEPEELTWKNETGSTTTVYIGIDSFMPIEDSFGGSFSLGITCEGIELPAIQSSWGAMKSRFR